jgi:hypothetical protein
MIRTVCWKEYREQRWVWLVFLTFGVSMAVGAPWIVKMTGPPPYFRFEQTFPFTMAFVVSVVYAIICSSLLLAGEKDGGTQPFLDVLVGERNKLWLAKACFGGASALSLAALAATCAALATPNDPTETRTGSLLFVLSSSCVAYCVGLLASALCRRVASAAVLAVACFIVFPVVFLAVMTPSVLTLLHWLAMALSISLPSVGFSAYVYCRRDGLFASRFMPKGRHVVWLALLGLALLASFWAYRWSRQLSRLTSDTWLDLGLVIALAVGAGLAFAFSYAERSLATAEAASSTTTAGPALVRMAWLSIRQGKAILVALLIGLPWLVAFLFITGAGVWPFGTLAIGLICGIASCAADQHDGAYRFLGDRRFPPARSWAPKTVLWFALAACLTMVFCGSVLLASVWTTVSRPSDHTAVDWFLFRYGGAVRVALLWLVHGFALGQFFTVYLRNTWVAAVLGTAYSLAITMLWVPSMMMGGISLWHLLLVPCVAMALSRAGVWPWVSDRMTAGRIVASVGTLTVLAFGWQSGMFWWRANEFGNPGEPPGIEEYLATVPSYDNNKAGQLISQAIVALQPDEKDTFEDHIAKAFALPGEYRENTSIGYSAPWRPQFQTNQMADDARAAGVVKLDEADPDFRRMLDRLFASEWYKTLKQLPDVPVGMMLGAGYRPEQRKARRMQAGNFVNLLAWRSLQLQDQGAHEEALEQIRIQLALVRNLSNHDTDTFPNLSLSAELKSLHSLRRWLDHLGPNEALIEKALLMLRQHQELSPNFRAMCMAAYLAREREEIAPNSYRKLPYALTTFLNLAAWEQTRLERFNASQEIQLLQIPTSSGREYFSLLADLYAAQNQSIDPDQRAFLWQLGYGAGTGPYRYFEVQREVEVERLRLALSLFRCKEGRLADNLNQLVPTYLQSLPPDPLLGHPFGYAISDGGDAELRKLDPNRVLGPIGSAFQASKPGEAILWCLGENQLRDNQPFAEFFADGTAYRLPPWTAAKTESRK